MTTVRSRARGALVGSACGDALGRPVEFYTPHRIASEHGTVTEMLGGGTHGQPAGTVTDDTEMALRLARSLVARGGFDGADVAARFVSWYESGPFDIGLMTADVLRRIRDGDAWDEAGARVWRERPEGSNAGNGSVMRCVPNALAHLDDEDELDRVSRRSSEITHADPRCTAGCAVLNGVVARFLRGDVDADAVGSVVDDALDAADARGGVPNELAAALRGLPGSADPDDLAYHGYVVSTLRAATYHALSADDFETAVVDAVNRGEDADTVGAVTGAIAGARFGEAAIPDRWREAVAEVGELRSLADELIALSGY